MLTTAQALIEVTRATTRYGIIRLTCPQEAGKQYESLCGLAGVAQQFDLLFGVDYDALIDAARALWEAQETHGTDRRTKKEREQDVERPCAVVNSLVSRIEHGCRATIQVMPTTHITVDDAEMKETMRRLDAGG